MWAIMGNDISCMLRKIIKFLLDASIPSVKFFQKWNKNCVDEKYIVVSHVAVSLSVFEMWNL